MKNIKISTFCAIIITSIAYSSQNDKSRKLPFTPPVRTHFTPPLRTSPFNKTEAPNLENIEKETSKKIPFTEKLNAVHTVFQIAKDIYSLLPNESDQQTKKQLEQYNATIAEQREVNTARRSFYKCCQNNQGFDVERIKNGLPVVCQNVALDYAAFGYRNDIEKAVKFFNKFRE